MSSERDPIFGCELATGRRDKDGYAFHGRVRAHIAAWTGEYGAIADGLELDHLCRRRHCVALHHLEAITRGENECRKSFGYRVRRKLCPNGHNMELNRVITPEGGCVCRACNRLALGGVEVEQQITSPVPESCQASGSRTDPSSVRDSDTATCGPPGRATPS